jgi:8-oxo-dGTP pyrophosphatase MutT (NUDIX family)
MPASPYVRSVRARIGNDLLMLPSVAVMLFDDRGRLLLAQETGTGLWITIGGQIDPDESPSDAAVRECWEETGLLIEPTSVLGVFGGPAFRITYANGDIVSYVAIVFEARRIDGDLRPDGSEVSALRFVSQPEIPSLPMVLGTREVVTRAFEHAGTSHFAQPTWRPPVERTHPNR